MKKLSTAVIKTTIGFKKINIRHATKDALRTILSTYVVLYHEVLILAQTEIEDRTAASTAVKETPFPSFPAGITPIVFLGPLTLINFAGKFISKWSTSF